MSVKVQALVWDHYPAGGNELLVALKVADHADHDGDRIWPGVASLAKLTRQSERSVQRSLRAMVSRGWLEIVKPGGAGPGQTTRYRIPVHALLLDLAAKGDILSPIQGRVTPPAKKGDNGDGKGDIAMSPESSVKQPSRETVKGSGEPSASPAALLFRKYQDGIRKMYGGEYPGSASANGQLAHVVKRLGASASMAALDFYLAARKPYYVTRKHALEVFVKDCAALYLDAQQAGAPAFKPTKAAAFFLLRDGRREFMDDYPLAAPMDIARRCVKEYAGKARAWDVAWVEVKFGPSQVTRYGIQELTTGGR